eukprot:scaffold204559_cov53-Prasinocladus_malaysianus.AAC.1
MAATAFSPRIVAGNRTGLLRRCGNVQTSARPARSVSCRLFRKRAQCASISRPGRGVAHEQRRFYAQAAGNQATMTKGAESAEANKPTKNGFHVHFGAGKLGMGLVFNGMVGSDVPFAIMQPPFEGDGDVLLNDDRVKVLINGEETLPGGLAVVNKDTYPNLKDAMKTDRSIVLIHPGEEWDEIISNATSFSCSIGPKVNDIIGPVLEKNVKKMPLEMRPKLFACENDHGAVEKLGERLKGRIEVIPCMVDRICSGREMSQGEIQ